MRKTNKRYLIVALAAVAVGSAAFLILRLIAPPKDLRGALAAALHVPKDRQADFFINLPPAGSRYPGAILVVPQMLVLEQSTANDAGITEGIRFGLSASDSAVADALTGFSSTLLTTAGRDKENVEVTLNVSDGRVLEMPVADLKQRLLSSESAQSAANKGTDPVVITRAYAGILTFTLRQKSSAGARLIANAAKAPELNMNGSVKLDASKAGQGEISIHVDQPVVFAFEASSARYITNHLGSGPDDVSLTPIKPSDVRPSLKTSTKSPTPWTLATISSGYYEHLRTTDQPWNARSADALESSIKLFGPQSIMRFRATLENPLTSSALTNFLTQVAATAKQGHSQFVLVYYVGHSLSWPNADVAVVLDEAEQIPEPKRDYTNAAIAQRVGANVGALFQLSDALNANLEKLPPGYMPLRDLYSELDKIQIPFALLVDGCLRNDEFEQFRNSLGLTSDAETRTFFYTGPDGQLLNSLNEFDQKLRHFADGLPYLHATNPVVLAAKPGTFAQPWPDPDLDWGQVGPLSARITNYVRSSLWDEQPPTLGEVISNVTDYKGTGEISPKGSISWSDFEPVKRVTAEFKLGAADQATGKRPPSLPAAEMRKQ